MTDGPHHGQSSTGPAARAADPSTPQVQLHMIAGDHPELRPLIAENPNTYPELLQWLAELDDPEINAALARRGSGSAGAAPEQPTTMLPTAGGAPRADSGTEEFSAVRQDRPQSYTQPTAAQPTAQDYPAAPQSYGAPQAQGYDQPRAGYYPAAPAGPAPWEAPPASYVEPEPAPRRRGGGTCAILFLILLLAVAAVVAAYFLIFNGVFSGDETTDETAISEEQAEGEAPPADQQAEDGSEEAEGGTEDDAEAARPAPEDAQNIPAFTAPSGNINCALGEDELECSILDYNFDTPEDCDGPARLSVGAESPQVGCGSTEGENSATLQYGQSASNGRFACVSSESGFECWNTETGNGFFMSREDYQLQD